MVRQEERMGVYEELDMSWERGGRREGEFEMDTLARDDLQSWTGPCITPSPCINVTFPPFTTKNIEVFCALHAVNSSS